LGGAVCGGCCAGGVVQGADCDQAKDEHNHRAESDSGQYAVRRVAEPDASPAFGARG
jgi:hypothetical protein